MVSTLVILRSKGTNPAGSLRRGVAEIATALTVSGHWATGAAAEGASFISVGDVIVGAGSAADKEVVA